MKGEHSNVCLKGKPDCLCNKCKHDPGSGYDSCCDIKAYFCPILDCPDYEPDDEEDGAE